MEKIMNTNTVTVGLIAGRHELPVDRYIFDEIKDVLDFEAVKAGVSAFLQEQVGITQKTGTCINQNDYTDVQMFSGCKKLVVYVTGLTSVVAEVISQCALNGVSLTLMHFDRDSGKYVPQRMF